MHAPSRLAFVGWLVVSAGGCALVTGLDKISEQDCTPQCGDAQAAQDATTDMNAGDVTTNQDAVSTPDQETGNDAAEESSQPPEASTSDAPSESSLPPEAGADAVVDAPADAPFDSGCGPLNVADNCSACSDKCAAVSSSVTSASCAGASNGTNATCQYSCATSYLDCNGPLNPPDLDGCECHSPGASLANCGSGVTGTPGCCPVQHSDGLTAASYPSETFFDCLAAPSTPAAYTQSLAMDACVEFAGNQANCVDAGECSANDAGTGDFVVCAPATGSSPCACWEYMGPSAGKVTVSTGAAQGNCYCPGSSGSGISTYNYN